MTDPTALNLIRRLADALTKNCSDFIVNPQLYPEVAEASAYLAAHPKPATEATDEEWLPELRGRFERILCVARSSGGRTVGNIELADRLISAVVPISRPWGHQPPRPIPLSERLPTEADCNAANEVWLWDWLAEQWVLIEYRLLSKPGWEGCHWLPAHALPLPEAQP